jgi:hypothetical protein
VLQWAYARAHCSTVAQSGRARIHFNNFVAAGDQKKHGFWMNAREITGKRSVQTLSRRKTRVLGSSPSLATSGGISFHKH